MTGVRRGGKGERRARKAREDHDRALTLTSLPFYGLPRRLTQELCRKHIWLLKSYIEIKNIMFVDNRACRRVLVSFRGIVTYCLIAQLIGCQSTVREVKRSSPRPDQHSGS